MSDKPIFKSTFKAADPSKLDSAEESRAKVQLEIAAEKRKKAASKPGMKKLTPKQEVFCAEYMKDLNATQAAIRAGYSENSAQQMGSENLLKPVISNKIQLLMSQRMLICSMEAAEIVKLVYNMAMNAEKEESRLKALEMLMRHTGAYAPVEIKEEKKITIEIVGGKR